MAKTRILVANVVAAEEDSEAGHIFKTVAVDLWKRGFGPAMQPDTELTFRFPRRGLGNLEARPYAYMHALADSEILYMIMQAEREGFDGAIIACSHWISRKGVFARPSAEAVAGGRSVLEYTGPGFWDCQ